MPDCPLVLPDAKCLRCLYNRMSPSPRQPNNRKQQYSALPLLFCWGDWNAIPSSSRQSTRSKGSVTRYTVPISISKKLTDEQTQHHQESPSLTLGRIIFFSPTFSSSTPSRSVLSVSPTVLCDVAPDQSMNRDTIG